MKLIIALALIGVAGLFSFKIEDDKRSNTKKETCENLMSSTERTKDTIVFQGADIHVYNPSTICDKSTQVFCIQSIKVNGLKINFKINIEENKIKIPLTELNLKMESKVAIELRHYSFARPEFLNK